jgi:uncharacterized membrane protein
MITKRQLGVGIAIFGLILGLAILAVDWLGAGNEMGIGPSHRLALVAAGALFVFGMTLIPLGNRPA